MENTNIFITDDPVYIKDRLSSAVEDDNALILFQDSKVRSRLEAVIKGTLRTEKGVSYDVIRRSTRDKEDFRQSFSSSLRSVNRSNGSLKWWSMDLTSGNPLLSALYDNAYHVCNILKELKTTKKSTVFIVPSNVDIALQIKNILGNKLPKANLKLIIKYSLKDIIVRRTTVLLFIACVRVLIRKILSSLFIRVGKCEKKDRYLLITHFTNKNFDSNGGYKDAFFKGLSSFVRDEDKDVKTLGFVGCTNIFKIVTVKEKDVFPIERFLKYPDILKILFFPLLSYGADPKLFFSMDGYDLSWLLREEVIIAMGSGQMTQNLAVHYSMKSCFDDLKPDRVIYPFENRAWEKMIILAFRRSGLRGDILGYQHASLLQKHVNFYMGENEPNEIPFPDKIIAMGKTSKDMMINTFGFPEEKILQGCAIRQSLKPDDISKTLPPGDPRRILVVLASNVDEYVNVLKLLDSAGLENTGYDIVIRPHPGIDINSALKIFYPGKLKYTIDKEPLERSLSISDIVVYASSTVALEAVSMGLPVIFLDMDDALSPDPLFSIKDLKWHCKNPEEFKNIVREISQMPVKTFNDLRKNARKFAEDYFVPATKTNKRIFIEDIRKNP